ncbi:MAG TPA: DUF3857 domain-containing protein [Chitinophagales bacterium]|nr:DUF3857 domain-containing protein [Chitinophagales bacterium]
MSKKIILNPLLLVLLFIASIKISSAQDIISRKYDWEAKPKPHVLSGDDTKAKEIGLKDKRILEYVYTEDRERNLVMYYMKHTIVKVNTQEAIEDFNKIYVPTGGVLEVVKMKARSITKDGKVTTLTQNDIKKTENEESGADYQYFAMEGLEPGSEVEYLYILKFDAQLFGNEILQNDYPKKNLEFDLYTPENLEFAVKSYNGLVEMKADTNYKDGRHWSLSADYLPALNGERYATYNANLQRVEYTLAYNRVSSDKRMLDWGRASETFFNQYFVDEDKEVSEVAKYMKKLDIKGSSDKEKVFWLDNYLKSTIALQRVANPDLQDIRKILSSKTANSRGMVRLYIAMLTQMNFTPELVLTTDRFKELFDGSFQTWNYLDKVLLFIPSLNIYLVPTEFDVRNGLPPQECIENDGFFIKKLTVGDLTSGVGKVKHIAASDYSTNRSDIYASVSLAEPFEEVKVKTKLVFTGYAAQSISQSYYDFLNDEQKKKITDALMQLMGDDSKAENIKVTNQLADNVEGHPFIFEADITLSSLIEKAGNKVLFKIGNVLGTQEEMYSEEKRENPIENEFNRGFYREITFTIPDGYQIKNLDALKLNVDMKEGNDTPCYFHASYTTQGNTVKVIIDEVYKKVRFPATEFEEFKKVINAAADYNKVVLILEKKV